MAGWMPKFGGQALRFGEDLWDPSHRFETSWLLPPEVLFVCRASIAFYSFTVIFFSLAWESTNHDGMTVHDARKSFSFFTVLCYWGISSYYFVASIHTLSYCLNGGAPVLNRLPRSLQALHYLLWTSITTYPFLVTIVFWTVIYPGVWFPLRFDQWSNISEHGLNSAFALFELLISRIDPAPWIHLLWLVVILIGYLGVAYLTYATKHYYVYSFLNPDTVGKVGIVRYVFGIAVAICIFFSLSKGVATLRKWLTEEKMDMRGKFFAGRNLGEGGEVDLDPETHRQRQWEK